MIKRRHALLAAATLVIASLVCGPGVSAQQNPGPAERAAGLLAEPRPAGENPGRASWRCARRTKSRRSAATCACAGRHRDALQVADRFSTTRSPARKRPEGGRSRPGRPAANSPHRGQGRRHGGPEGPERAGESAIFDMRENTVTLIGQCGRDPRPGRAARPRLGVDLTSGTSKMDGAEALFGRGGAMGPEKALGGEKK